MEPGVVQPLAVRSIDPPVARRAGAGKCLSELIRELSCSLVYVSPELVLTPCRFRLRLYSLYIRQSYPLNLMAPRSGCRSA